MLAIPPPSPSAVLLQIKLFVIKGFELFSMNKPPPLPETILLVIIQLEITGSDFSILMVPFPSPELESKKQLTIFALE